jgi:MSHA biogenesis protein MshK
MDGDMSGVKQQTKRMGSRGAHLLPFLVFSFLPFNSALANEILPDPTRPAAEAGMTGSVATVSGGPVLQSVMIRPGHRSAVIGGQLLAVGEHYGDAKLIRVSESEVVLAGPEGQQVLKLFPAVEKRLAHPPREDAPKRGKNKSKRNSEQKAS